ncbi:MAG: hypothetical protein FWG87_02000 [Defluviitaleaceae bacterium]|nr:hypothetical protein [Defluviitaleaceae bacterium]
MSNMVVRTNVFALNAHRNLTNTGLQQRQSSQRLSSGYRINSAADDAAGLAISESMRAQIRGLDQASINAQDGVGLIQTAEGAMSTISDMVIRIRELIVQAANDTNTPDNRNMIQLEIDQLMTEINDVTFRTQFNTRTLLDGGLTGGGGPTSAVSLQWMLFQQARVIGLPHPGATVGPGGLHPNPNDMNHTSMREQMIGLQNGLNDLARRISDRLVALPDGDPDKISTAERDAIFHPDRLDFSSLNGILTDAEKQELRNIQNRADGLLRTSLAAAQELFTTTSDQIRALGGKDAVNNDGSRVFLESTVDAWFDDATGGLAEITSLQEMILGVDADGKIGTLGAPAAGSLLADLGAIDSNDIQGLNDFIQEKLVGWTNATNTTNPHTATIPNPDYVDWANDPLNMINDPNYTDFSHLGAGFGWVDNDVIIAVAGGVPQIPDPDVTINAPGTWVSVGGGFFNEDDYDLTDTTLWDTTSAAADSPGADWGWIADANGGAGAWTRENLTIHATIPQVQDPAAPLVPDPDFDMTGYIQIGTTDFWVPGTYEFLDDPPQILDPSLTNPYEPTIPNPEYADFVAGGTWDGPTLNTLEGLLSSAMAVLADVNLESNAMWFQIGANSMQGMILQLKGMHTGILGGGRGDLAMLIDVRHNSGIPISEQLDLIKVAENVVNGQRAQLGAIQNRLEFTRQSLDISSENLSAAESRIRDTDMAKEMMRFTSAQVLQQAGISMLAQANQLPSSILQLLQ